MFNGNNKKTRPTQTNTYFEHVNLYKWKPVNFLPYKLSNTTGFPQLPCTTYSINWILSLISFYKIIPRINFYDTLVPFFTISEFLFLVEIYVHKEMVITAFLHIF